MSWFSDTWDRVTNKVADVTTSVARKAAGTAASWFGSDLLDRAWTLGGNLVTFAKKHYKIIPDLVDAVKSIANSEFVTKASKIFKSLAPKLGALVKEIASGSKNVYNYVKHIVAIVPDLVKFAELVSTGDKFFQLVKKHFDKLSSRLGKAWDDLAKIIKDGGESDIELKKVMTASTTKQQKAVSSLVMNAAPGEVNLNFDSPAMAMATKTKSDYTSMTVANQNALTMAVKSA